MVYKWRNILLVKFLDRYWFLNRYSTWLIEVVWFPSCIYGPDNEKFFTRTMRVLYTTATSNDENSVPSVKFPTFHYS